MASGDMADGEGHGQDRKTEGQRHADEADANRGKSRRQHRAAAPAEDQPKSAKSNSAI